MELSVDTLAYIWDFLGDNEVFFPLNKGDIFSNSMDKMTECFSVMEVYGDYLALQLKQGVTHENYEDCMGHFDGVPVEGSGKVALLQLYVKGKSFYDIEDYEFFGIEFQRIVDTSEYKHYIDNIE